MHQRPSPLTGNTALYKASHGQISRQRITVNKTRCIGNQWIFLPLTGPPTAINSAPHLHPLPLPFTPLPHHTGGGGPCFPVLQCIWQWLQWPGLSILAPGVSSLNPARWHQINYRRAVGLAEWRHPRRVGDTRLDPGPCLARAAQRFTVQSSPPCAHCAKSQENANYSCCSLFYDLHGSNIHKQAGRCVDKESLRMLSRTWQT